MLFLLAILSTSYAVLSVKLVGERKYSLTIGTLDFKLDNEKNAIRLMNAYPMSDEEGQALTPYTFSLTNTGTLKEYYRISLVTDTKQQESCSGCKFLTPAKLRYSLNINGVAGTSKTLSEITTLDSGELAANETKNYELRLWLRSEATIEEENKYYFGKIKVDISQEEYAREPNEPVLTSGMIAVTYDGSNWVKADTLNNNWYDYDNQIWANAVTVTKETRQTYMDMDAGEPISMDDINTMWVWIPRYSYTIRDTYGVQLAGGSTPSQTTPGAIDIRFISTKEKDNGTGTCTKYASNWVTPEGFSFGTEEIPGFWIGKFETSTLESCTAKKGSINSGCDLTTLTPQIKPNVTSWRGQSISTFFLESRLMQSSDTTLKYNADTYGFDTEGIGTMDVHMIKNTEWGIVAMLSQSKYGKYGNSNYTGVNKEVYQNKSSSFITGMSNGTPSQTSTTTPQVTYDIPDTGYGASTTGTIYGVYDMSGGTWEHVMGNYNNISGSNALENSGFCGINGPEENCVEWPDKKYYDLYASANMTSDYKFGDATYETATWYNEITHFISSSVSWFFRGGIYTNGDDAGIFKSGANHGISDTGHTSRLIIKP